MGPVLLLRETCRHTTLSDLDAAPEGFGDLISCEVESYGKFEVPVLWCISALMERHLSNQKAWLEPNCCINTLITGKDVSLGITGETTLTAKDRVHSVFIYATIL